MSIAHFGSAAARTCATCRFSMFAKSSDTGQCRRRTPLAAPYSEDEALGYWPLISTDDWCGEWRQSTPGPDQPAKVSPTPQQQERR